MSFLTKFFQTVKAVLYTICESSALCTDMGSYCIECSFYFQCLSWKAVKHRLQLGRDTAQLGPLYHQLECWPRGDSHHFTHKTVELTGLPDSRDEEDVKGFEKPKEVYVQCHCPNQSLLLGTWLLLVLYLHKHLHQENFRLPKSFPHKHHYFFDIFPLVVKIGPRLWACYASILSLSPDL